MLTLFRLKRMVGRKKHGNDCLFGVTHDVTHLNELLDKIADVNSQLKCVGQIRPFLLHFVEVLKHLDNRLFTKLRAVGFADPC